MVGRPEGVRKLLVAYDVAGYGSRDKLSQVKAQKHLVELVTYMFSEAGMPREAYETQKQGDGGLALLPTGTGLDEPQLLRKSSPRGPGSTCRPVGKGKRRASPRRPPRPAPRPASKT
jgi:hypothetical protein